MDYKLYYWDAPFRGIFIEYILVEAEQSFTREDASEIYPDKSLELSYSGMAPPYLYEFETKKYYSQMPAVVLYLARRNGLFQKVEDEYLTMKVVADCHDVLTEITNFYGTKMWTQESWDDFKQNRLSRWTDLFEIYIKKGLPRLGELLLAGLVGPMTHSFPKMESYFKETAPDLWSLINKIESEEEVSQLLKEQRNLWGKTYCGGEIEKSLRKVI